MYKKSVFCLATTQVQADLIVHQLQAAGFAGSDFTVLFPDQGTPQATRVGNFLVAVTTETEEQVERAREIFARTGTVDSFTTADRRESGDEALSLPETQQPEVASSVRYHPGP